MALMDKLPDSHILLMWSVAAPVVGQSSNAGPNSSTVTTNGASASTNAPSGAAVENGTNTNSTVHQSIRHGVLEVLTFVVNSLSQAHLAALVRPSAAEM